MASDKEILPWTPILTAATPFFAELRIGAKCATRSKRDRPPTERSCGSSSGSLHRRACIAHQFLRRADHCRRLWTCLHSRSTRTCQNALSGDQLPHSANYIQVFLSFNIDSPPRHHLRGLHRRSYIPELSYPTEPSTCRSYAISSSFFLSLFGAHRFTSDLKTAHC